MMNDIKATAPSRDDHWNYVEYSPFSEKYYKASISDKFNTLQFDQFDSTTDPDSISSIS